MMLTTLYSLFVDSLRRLAAAELQIARSLPRILEGVSSQELKSVVEEYLKETEAHCERFEAIGAAMGEQLTGERAHIAEAFLREAILCVERRGEDRVIDLAAMSILRELVHYEKSAYEIVRSIAEVIGESRVVELIDSILNETERTERAFILLTEDMMDSMSVAREKGRMPPPESLLSSRPVERRGH